LRILKFKKKKKYNTTVLAHSKFLIRLSLKILFCDYSLYRYAFYYENAFSFNEPCETVKIMRTIFAHSKIPQKKSITRLFWLQQ